MKKPSKILEAIAIIRNSLFGELSLRTVVGAVLRFVGGVLHRALFTVLLPKRLRRLSKMEFYTIIFKSDTRAGKKFDICLLLLIALNIIVMMFESISSAPRWFELTMRGLGWLFTILFTFEYYLRVYCLKRPWKYVLSFWGIIDFVSIFPAYLSLFFPAASTLSALRLMRVLRIFRIFHMDRFVRESRFLLNSLKRSAAKILIFMLFVFVMAVILGATMYGIEGTKNPAISSIPRGVYWAVVTLTTVGYGDIAPVTPLGQFVSMLVMLLGYSIIAVPTGIVAGETIVEHRRSDRRRPAEDRPAASHADPTPQPNPAPSQRRPAEEGDPAVQPRPEDLL